MWVPHGTHMVPICFPHGSQWDPAAISHMGLTWFPHGSHKDPQGSHMGPTWFPHASHVCPMWAFSVGLLLTFQNLNYNVYPAVKIRVRKIFSFILINIINLFYKKLYRQNDCAYVKFIAGPLWVIVDVKRIKNFNKKLHKSNIKYKIEYNNHNCSGYFVSSR